MYHMKQDKRAIRSSNMIFDALDVLIDQKNYQDITVSELVDQAQVGRATFYRNFDNIEDVLRFKCDQVFDDLFNFFVQQHKQTNPSDGKFPFLKPILQYFYFDSRVIELLIQANKTYLLQSAFRKRLSSLISNPANISDIPAVYQEYLKEIYSSTATNILLHWIRTGKNESPEELAESIKAITSQINKHSGFVLV